MVNISSWDFGIVQLEDTRKIARTEHTLILGSGTIPPRVTVDLKHPEKLSSVRVRRDRLTVVKYRPYASNDRASTCLLEEAGQKLVRDRGFFSTESEIYRAGNYSKKYDQSMVSIVVVLIAFPFVCQNANVTFSLNSAAFFQDLVRRKCPEF
jgi:hypothetical protein